jgi:hypothetical protein
LNVLIDENKALITDFGLSQFRGDMTTIGSTATFAGGLSGTPGFIAPGLFDYDDDFLHVSWR